MAARSYALYNSVKSGVGKPSSQVKGSLLNGSARQAGQVIRLPKLMLAANIKQTLDLLAGIVDSGEEVVRIDAHSLEFAEPLPLCLLAAQLNRLSRQGQTAIIEKVRPEVADRLRKMNVLADWLEARSRVLYRAHSMNSFHVCWVSEIEDADSVANSLADAIVQFVPAEFSHEHQQFRRDNVRTPLAYVIAELLDNALTHGRGKGFSHASAWIAAQYYSSGDLIRVAVIDDGCGFLRSLESHKDVQPKQHAVAVRTAFRAGVSCNKEVGLLKDALNAGIGLTMSRDIAIRSGGSVWAGSGDAWLNNPGRETEIPSRVPYWQGSMLNLELHRAGLNTFNFRNLLEQYYDASANNRIRFLY